MLFIAQIQQTPSFIPFLGPVPEELKNLTVIEEAMISRCRSKCWIIQLQEENQDLVLSTTQGGIKGHTRNSPRRLQTFYLHLLIRSPPLFVFYLLAHLPPEWLRNHAKPLAVNAGCVRVALQWLEAHNPLYRDTKTSEECLRELEQNPVLPFSAEHILPSAANEAPTARYDSTPAPPGDSPKPNLTLFSM
jgi:hypothetical protein